jgi:hypothetical protein
VLSAFYLPGLNKDKHYPWHQYIKRVRMSNMRWPFKAVVSKRPLLKRADGGAQEKKPEAGKDEETHTA